MSAWNQTGEQLKQHEVILLHVPCEKYRDILKGDWWSLLQEMLGWAGTSFSD